MSKIGNGLIDLLLTSLIGIIHGKKCLLGVEAQISVHKYSIEILINGNLQIVVLKQNISASVKAQFNSDLVHQKLLGFKVRESVKNKVVDWLHFSLLVK